MKAILLLALVLLGPFGSFPAQSDSCLNRTVAVNVVNKDGEMVKALTAKNFRAEVHGKPAKIESIEYKVGGGRVALLLDVSGSMTHPLWKMEASTTFLGYLLAASPPSLVSFALMTFNTRITDEVTFDRGREEVANRLAKIATGDWRRVNSGGRTGWLDATMEARHLLEPVHPTNAFFLVTDGADDASKTLPQELQKALLSQNARLFGFLIDVSPIDPDVEGGLGPGTLKDLVDVSGGSMTSLFYQISRSPGFTPDLPRVTEQQRQVMLSRARHFAQVFSENYIVNMRLPERLAKPERWRLDIMNSSGEKDENVHVLYPRQLAACN